MWKCGSMLAAYEDAAWALVSKSRTKCSARGARFGPAMRS